MSPALGFLLCALVFAVCFWAEVRFDYRKRKSEADYRLEGCLARSNGISATRNPYDLPGYGKDLTASQSWERGWILKDVEMRQAGKVVPIDYSKRRN